MRSRKVRGHPIVIGLGALVLVVVAAGGGKQLLAFAMIGLVIAMLLGVLVLRAVWRAARRPVTGLDLLIAAFVWRRWHRPHPVPGPTWPGQYSGPWYGAHYPPPTGHLPPDGQTSYPPP